METGNHNLYARITPPIFRFSKEEIYRMDQSSAPVVLSFWLQQRQPVQSTYLERKFLMN